MRHFRDWSITTRLFALTIGGSVIALLLSCTFFLLENIYSYRNEKAKQLETIADMLEYHCEVALRSNDKAEGDELLETLRNTSSVEYAFLLDKGGQIFAERIGQGATVPPDAKTLHKKAHSTEEQSHYVDRSRYEIFQPVVEDDKRIGTIYLRAQTDIIKRQTWLAAQVTILVAAIALGASLLFTWLMQRSISRPILNLVDTAQSISQKKDYSLRAKKVPGRNELAVLTGAFNAMLDEIQTAHDRLKGTYDDLEMRVDQQTVQLRNEVSRHEETREELVRAKELAEAANRAKSEFLANMSHEIRTPMTAILGFSDLLRKGAYDDDPEAQREQLNLIYISSRHLLELINDILDLSKVEAGEHKSEPVDCSVHQIVRDVIAVQQVTAVQKDLFLKYEWSTPIPETIRTDPSQLRQVLINLIGNAIKFTSIGGVTVTMGMTEKSGKALLAVRVTDTGVGIPEPKLQRIFEPFVQADTSVTRQFGGTGLGLAICRRIAKMLGGRLTVKSKPGKGSTFTVMINPGDLDGVRRIKEMPESQTDESSGLGEGDSDVVLTMPADATLSGPHEALSGSRYGLHGIQILLVEDGEINRKLLSLILERAGAGVTTAENGEIGVRLARQKPFDLILMDMQMPVMDGYSAATKIRQLDMDTPIIALTAHAMVGDAKQCHKAGCNQYLSKPVEEDLLCKTIFQAVEEYRKNQSVPRELSSGAVPDDLPIHSTLPIDDPDFRQVVFDFITQLGEWIAQLKTALVKQDLESLRVLSHCLKGSAGMAGFRDFTRPATELNRAVHNEDWEPIREKVNEIVRLGQQVRPPEVRNP